jgi:hypothetical protein
LWTDGVVTLDDFCAAMHDFAAGGSLGFADLDGRNEHDDQMVGDDVSTGASSSFRRGSLLQSRANSDFACDADESMYGSGAHDLAHAEILASLRDATGLVGPELRDVMGLVDDLVVVKCTDLEAGIAVAEVWCSPFCQHSFVVTRKRLQEVARIGSHARTHALVVA